MIKAVIFDFDGLILDTETAWYDTYKQILKETHDYDLPLSEFVKGVGGGDDALLEYIEKEVEGTFQPDVFQEKVSVMHAERLKEAESREGVEDYLKEASDAGYQIAIASSSDRKWVTTHLTNLGLIDYFDHFVTSDDVEKIKPAPDLFLKAIEVLDVQPEEAIIFEDSLNGLVAARKANIKTIIVPNPVTESLPFEDHHLKIGSMKEMRLAEIIKSVDNAE
ncbi:HAD family hydrolase [Oceanobacillus manasiensis]|uniref:HAD family hydrolase n=1 Tax=Oceanobacillus manasiensis TaxID=586413 RepID=UPI0005A669BE|nr:HAD family hydrolase [Oceanobacillus manasiensis]